MHVDWSGLSQTPLLKIPNKILKETANRLYVDSARIGDKLSPMLVVNGHTGFEINGTMFKCPPCYAKTGCWYD